MAPAHPRSPPPYASRSGHDALSPVHPTSRLERLNGRGALFLRGAVIDLGLDARADGGPVRLRRNGRQPKAVGLYFSVKSGRHLPYESRLKLHDLWRAEVASDVVRSQPQPFTLRFMLDGQVRRYTPDRRDLLVSGAEQIVEIRDDGEAGEGGIEEVVRSILSARGMSYVVRRRSEIEAEPTFSAVEIVQRNRRAQVSSGQVVAVRSLLANRPQPLADVLTTLPPGPSGFATACAMMVRRLIAIDLSQGLSAHSCVSLVSPC